MLASSQYYMLAMFVAGLAIPVMAGLNSTLGGRLGSPSFAALILFAVALLAAAAVVAIRREPISANAELSPYLFLGGFVVAGYVLGMTYAAPKIGVGNAVVLVLFGQLICAALLDHFALIGVPENPITLKRLAGFALIGTGVVMAVRPI